ncbi:DUF669 domain-containing protein [Methylosinus sp. PW1]|uniref:DUF669 domain-containing protein n=1 Tax=Methylosinus sp. PW1 TaxID=107636 RepID=UPI000566A23D|nr:DUF669 domain-containing protein [Methylosinus sp. PW1]
MSTYDDDEVFDPSTVEIEEIPLIPARTEVTLQATQAVVKETKNGEMYAITFEVIDGQYEGRMLWENYNFRNASEKAQQIGRESLAKLCFAVGAGAFRKSEAEQAICFKPFVGTIGIRKGEGNYADQNSIRAYKPLDGAGQPPARPQTAKPQRATQAQTAAATQQQAAAGGGSRPWQRPAR